MKTNRGEEISSHEHSPKRRKWLGFFKQCLKGGTRAHNYLKRDDVKTQLEKNEIIVNQNR
jgi:hypothetical protein